MTGRQFTTWAEATFGRYLPAMKAEVEKWFTGEPEMFADAMCDIALKEHPSVYGKPPGVYELEQFRVRAKSHMHDLMALNALRNPRPALPEVAGDMISEEEAEANAERVWQMLGGRPDV